MVIGGLDITDNLIRVRQVEPSEFDKKTLRTIRITSGIKAITGRKTGETSTTIQSLLFDKKKFTPEKVKSWLAKHKEKFSQAITLEEQKASLFQDDPLIMLEEHTSGHLPRLSPKQVAKLMELAGEADDEDDDDDDDVPDMEEDSMMKFNDINKYVKVV